MRSLNAKMDLVIGQCHSCTIGTAPASCAIDDVKAAHQLMNSVPFSAVIAGSQQDTLIEPSSVRSAPSSANFTQCTFVNAGIGRGRSGLAGDAAGLRVLAHAGGARRALAQVGVGWRVAAQGAAAAVLRWLSALLRDVPPSRSTCNVIAMTAANRIATATIWLLGVS